MADTINTPVTPEDGWVSLVTSGSGLITASKDFQYCQQTAEPPSGFIGHHLKTMSSLRYSGVTAPLRVKVSQNTVFVVTED